MKISEIFEGENSSLKKSFDNCCSKQSENNSKVSVYVYRDIDTKKIEEVMLRNEDIEIDEDRTGFYFEGFLDCFDNDLNIYLAQKIDKFFKPRK